MMDDFPLDVPWDIEVLSEPIVWVRTEKDVKSEQTSGYAFIARLNGEPKKEGIDIELALIERMKLRIVGMMKEKMLDEDVPVDNIKTILIAPQGVILHQRKDPETLQLSIYLQAKWWAKDGDGKIYGSKFTDPVVDNFRDAMFDAIAPFMGEE